MSKPHREIELKLEVLPEVQDLLKRTAIPEGFQSSRAVTKALHSIYFDTPDQALRRAKISLRVRKDGQSWVQTVKLGTGVIGGLSSAVEAEHPVPGRAIDLGVIEDPQILNHLVETLAGQMLSEACETLMKRTTRILTANDGSKIEVAFDTGEIKAGDKSRALSEVELELKEGSGRSLYAAAEGMLGATPFRFSPYSKAERGFRLAGGEDTANLQPALASDISLIASESVEHAFRSVLRSCLEQIAQNRATILSSDDPEGPHQMRIGLRRLRSAFRLFKPALNANTLAPLDDAARAIALRVGALRDLDALSEDIISPLADQVPNELSIEPLKAHLASLRAEERKNLAEYLITEEVNRFIFDLAAYTEARGWLEPEMFDQTERLAAPILSLAGPALDKQWKKASRYGRHIEELTIPERHEMRKALKKLRYGVEFFGALYPRKDVKPFLKQLKRLQDVFGYLNDVAMAEKLLTMPKARGAVAQAIGYAVGWHEAQSQHMWNHARDYWGNTKATRKFWR
ncbi:CHAD domain-containing protein [Roseibium sp.]|uniref:CYTH and CHAD domain-containing protein n=1 Tax=Roseibium sp. TaxID=1936156 RepID=UPI003A982F8D